MRTDEAIEKIANLAPAVTELVVKLRNDKDFADFMQKQKSGVSNPVFVMSVIPVITKNCSAELYKCLSILFGKTEEEVKAQSIRETIKQVREIMADEDMIYFFKLWREKTDESVEQMPE